MTLEEALAAVTLAGQNLASAEAAFGVAQTNLTAAAQAKNEAQRALDALLAGNSTPEPEPETFAERKAAKRLAIDRRAATAKDAGIVMNGTPIPTTSQSQQDITSAVVNFQLDPQMTHGSVKLGGVWVTLDKATVFAIAVAVGRYIQACQANAKALDDAAAAAANDTALDAIDIEAGWPARVIP